MSTESRRAKPFKRVLVTASLAATYFVAARLGLSLAFVNRSATAVWPPTGIALAALLLLGTDVWPAVFTGAFFANLATAGTVLTSAAIATGNTLEAVVGAYLVNRFAHGRYAMDRASDVVRFAALSATVSTAASATIGVLTLAAGGLAPWHDFGAVWITWWLGDASGDLVMAPVILLWAARPRVAWMRGQLVEALGVLVMLAVVALVVFGGFTQSAVANDPLAFLCTPFVLWVAYRFGQRETATAIVALSAVAIWGTLHGFGPFGRRTPNTSLLMLQIFVGVNVVMGLVVAALVSERRDVEEQLRTLAVRDSLTGLANYRHFVAVLHTELVRADRTGREFAVLFLDLDRLKSINDRLGHLAGSHALRRVARAVESGCRDMDTPARYGGDEFAVVLPETDRTTAQHVGARIVHAVAADSSEPRITVSVGVATYPRDGVTAEELLAAADRLLYNAKAAKRFDSSERAPIT